MDQDTRRGEIPSKRRELSRRFSLSRDFRARIAELAAEPDLVGHTIGRYKIISAVGAGAIGEV
jgi:hypothetical protein